MLEVPPLFYYDGANPKQLNEISYITVATISLRQGFFTKGTVFSLR